MKKLNRRFGVVVDSDRKNKTDDIPKRKLDWKKKCEEDGGIFYILRKRESENYLHPNAISRLGKSLQQYDDFTDMKKLFGDDILIKAIPSMTSEEILEMDKYYDENSIEHHELKEIVDALLSLVKE